MLSTSRIKLQNQYLLVALLILVLLISAIVVYQSGVLPTISAGQPATQNLTTLSAADVSAYRWEAMSKFYAAQGAQIPVTGGDLTTLSAADISAYRSEAMAKFYAVQGAQIPVTGGDLTTLSDAGISAYRSDAMAQYYLSERTVAQGSAFHYGPPGR